MKVHFWLRKNREGKTATIYVHITSDGKRTKTAFSSNLSIEMKDWNTAKAWPKNQAYLVASQLDQIKKEINHLYLKQKDKNIYVSPEVLKADYLKKEQPSPLFLDFALEVIRQGGGRPRTEQTYQGYLKNIGEFFEKERWTELNLQQLEIKHISKFELHMKQSGNFSHNYICKHIQLFKMVMKQAHLKGITTENPIHYYPVNMKKPKEPVFLTDQELAVIEKTTFIEGLQEVADCFRFQCYTGFSYDCLKTFDYQGHTFKRPDGKTWIKKARGKTNENAILPLLPEAETILNKYGMKLPVFANAVMNRYLKQVQLIAGISKKLTTHIGRKTFGMRMLTMGMSIESVSRMMGHANTRITQSTYTRLLPERIELEFKALEKAS